MLIRASRASQAVREKSANWWRRRCCWFGCSRRRVITGCIKQARLPLARTNPIGEPFPNLTFTSLTHSRDKGSRRRRTGWSGRSGRFLRYLLGVQRSEIGIESRQAWLDGLRASHRADSCCGWLTTASASCPGMQVSGHRSTPSCHQDSSPGQEPIGHAARDTVLIKGKIGSP